MRSGFPTAALFMETLSAPARSMARMSPAVLTPPPIVYGTKTSSAAARASVGRRLPLFVGGGDVVEDDLIRPLPIVEGRELYRISRVPQVGEVRPLYHPPGVHVEAGYDAHLEAH